MNPPSIIPLTQAQLDVIMNGMAGGAMIALVIIAIVIVAVIASRYPTN